MLSYCKTEKEDRVYIFLRQNKGTKQYQKRTDTSRNANREVNQLILKFNHLRRYKSKTFGQTNTFHHSRFLDMFCELKVYI